MTRPSIVLRRFLDPRPAADAQRAPFDNSVNIPLEELPARMHELPAGMQAIELAPAGACTEAARVLLERRGRFATIAREINCGLAGDSRQATSEAALGRLWRPTPFLEEIEPVVRAALLNRLNSTGSLRCLDLACGTGRDVVYLASQGWNATGVDILPDAIARAAALADRYRPALHCTHFVTSDLAKTGVSTLGEFNLVTQFRFLVRARMPAFLECVAPGGYIAIETFTKAHRARFGKPCSDAHLLDAGELPRMLDGLELITYDEAETESASTARALARRT